MKKKLQFLFSMVALMLVATFAKAQVTINTDLTAQFPTDWQGWTGASGAVGWAAPQVTTNDGRVVAACEAYNEGTIAQTGVVFSRKLTGLANGTYMIELYGAAAFTPGRSCSSTLEEGDETAVYLYAETPAGTVKQFIPAHVADNFNGTGIATATLPNVEVTDGTITIGMYKEKGLTNWHVVQIKGVTATVDAVEVLSASVTAAKAIEESSVSANIYAAIQTALSDYNKEWSTADEYKAAIAAIDATVDAANAYIMAKDVMGAMKSLVDATNVYTADAYEEYYGQWAAKFEAGTLTKAEAQVLQDPSLGTGWHASINVDNFLLSAWDTKPDFPEGVPYYINTWSVEGDNDGTNFRVPFFEYFTADANSLGAKTLTATMEGLIPGQYYKATAWVRNQPKTGVAAADVTGITLQVNDGTPVDVTEGEVKGGFNIGEFSAKGVVGEDGKLLIKFIVADENNSHWLSFKNVKFEAAEPDYGITIDNEITNGSVEASPKEAEAGATVTLTITPAAGYELDELTVMAGETPVTVAEGYTFEMPASAVTVSATFKEKAVEPETALIKNADFSESTPLDNHLCGYGKDMEKNGTTYYGLQDVEGWNKYVISGDNTTAAYPNSGMGGGVFAYGSSYQLKGNNNVAPTAGPDGGEGQALGFFGVWGTGGYYYQDVTLPAGSYTLIVPIYNASGTQANETQTGFFVNNSDVKYTVAINPTVGQWTTQSVEFTLTEETAGQIRVGYKSTGSGSAANPMIFIDQVKLKTALEGALELYEVAMTAANDAAKETIVTGEEMTSLNEAIAANSNIDKTSIDAIKEATTALNNAAATVNTAKASYQQLADTKAMVDFDAWPYASAEKKVAVEDAMNTTATSAEDATAKTAAIAKAYRQFVESNALAEGVEGAVNMTDKIVNPTAEEAIASPWIVVKGEGSGGALDVKKDEPWTDGSDNSTHKYFDGGNWGAQSWDVSLEQEITLDPGKYMLTAIARASGDVAFSLYAGETKVTIPAIGATGGVFNRGWNDQFVEFEVEQAGAVKIGVQGVTDKQYNWMSFSNFRLVQLEAYAAPELANPSFEVDGEKAASNGPLAITGWTETVDGSYNNSELRPANSASTTSMFGTSDPSDGEYSFFVRHGWNSTTTTITLTSDALGEIPAGDYTLSVDYKQHYAYDNTQNSNTKVSIALVNGETILGSETSPAAAGVAGSGDATYFNDAEWSTLTAAFTLAEAIPAGAKVVITLDARGQKRSDFFLDNVQFVKVPGIEFALKDLEKSIKAATDEKAKYSVGDDLFQYAATEIEPLTNAITTAQDAYNAAESKDAVNSAKETLDAFVATFAPVMTTPAADKLYTLQNKQASEQALEGEEVANHYLTLSAGGIGIATTPQALKFEAAEGGKFYITDGEYYVGLAGTDNWSMSSAADKKEALTISATLVGEAVYYTLGESKGMVGADYPKKENKGCWANKGAGDGDAVLWTIAEYVEPTDPNDYTNMIVNADLTGEGGFDATDTKGIDGSGVVKVGSAAAFDFKQTIANLPAGQYKLTAQAAYRYGADEAAEAAAIAGGTETKLVQLYATVGEKTVAVPVQNRYDGASETNYFGQDEGVAVVNEKYVPNSTNAVKAWFAAGQYVNEVIFNIAEAGDVTIGINRTGTPESDYTVIGPWTLYRLGDAEVEPEVPSFAGIVEQTVTHPKMGEIGTTTSDQTVKIAEAGEGLVDITFSGFSIVAPPTTFEQFTISNVAAETAADGSITYAAGNFQIATKMGQMDVYYNGTLEGVQASAEATPLFKLVLANAVTDEVYFGADQDAIDAYKASLQPAVYAIAIADEIEGGEVEADVEEAAEGAKVTLTITPDQDYKLGTVTVSYVEGESEGAETKYVEVAEDYTFTMPAAPVTVSATFTYVEPLDPNLIEIAQSQSPQISDGATRATVVEGDGYTQYTTDGNVCVIVKMYDVDVTGCDYVVIKFAEPIPSGICAAFWAQGSLDNIGLDAGITEYKYVFANDTKCAIQNGILPQITLLTLWNAQTVKISGIYKHLDEEGQVQINDIDAAKAKRNGKFYKKGQFVILNEGKAFSLNGIETK